MSRKTVRGVALALAGALGLITSSASAAPPPVAKAHAPRFGDAGTVALSGAFGIGLGWYDYDDGNVYTHAFNVSPELHVFVAENFSIGGSAYGAWSRSQGYSTRGSLDRDTRTTFGGALAFGYNVRLSRRVSFWPRVHLGFSTTSSTTESNVPSQSDEFPRSPDLGGLYWERKVSGAYLYAFAPLLLHPVPHFFVGVGPTVYQDLGVVHENSYPAKNDRTSFGLTTTVGIWF